MLLMNMLCVVCHGSVGFCARLFLQNCKFSDDQMRDEGDSAPSL